MPYTFASNHPPRSWALPPHRTHGTGRPPDSHSLYETSYSGTPRRPAPSAPRARRGENNLSALE